MSENKIFIRKHNELKRFLENLLPRHAELVCFKNGSAILNIRDKTQINEVISNL